MVPLSDLPIERWRFTTFRLPRGHFGASGVGLARGNICGNVETIGERINPHWWIGERPVKVEPHRKGRIRFTFARGDQIVGKWHTGQKEQAVLWSAGSDLTLQAVDLHPAGFERSVANGCWNGWQIGTGIRGGAPVALLWRGHASGVAELRGPRGRPAHGYALADGWQVGAGGTEFFPSRALLWHGESESVVELHPPNMYWSEARSVGDGEQVGSMATEAMWGGATLLPVLWRGSASSVTNLLPADCDSGQAFDCAGGLQVGVVRWGDNRTGVNHAALWGGSALAYVDLHRVVPPPWTDSAAQSIHVLDDRVVIVGELRLMSPDRRGVAGHQAATWEATLPAAGPAIPPRPAQAPL